MKLMILSLEKIFFFFFLIMVVLIYKHQFCSNSLRYQFALVIVEVKFAGI
jgi:hypothetical protein